MVGVIPGMDPTGTAGDGESPNSSVEKSGCVTQKEGGPGTKRVPGGAPNANPQSYSIPQPQPFSPESPLESLEFENERRALVRGQKEHAASHLL